MENNKLMQKLYDIARATRTTGEYTSYLECVAQGNSFSAHDLAYKIYKAAMIKYEASVRKHASAIDPNCDSMAEQLHSVKEFAIRHGVLQHYMFYLERLVSNFEKFNMLDALNQLTKDAIYIHDLRLRNKIAKTSGITFAEGYLDAV